MGTGKPHRVFQPYSGINPGPRPKETMRTSILVTRLCYTDADLNYRSLVFSSVAYYGK